MIINFSTHYYYTIVYFSSVFMKKPFSILYFEWANAFLTCLIQNSLNISPISGLSSTIKGILSLGYLLDFGIGISSFFIQIDTFIIFIVRLHWSHSQCPYLRPQQVRGNVSNEIDYSLELAN